MVGTAGTRRLGLAVLVVAILGAGVGARAAAVHGKAVLTHDESISYPAATCHQGEYGRLTERLAAPVGTWVPASAWQRFLRPEPRWCFGTIRADLAGWDIHPPAYFWLLHAWTRASGRGLATGALLGAGGRRGRAPHAARAHGPVTGELRAAPTRWWSTSPGAASCPGWRCSSRRTCRCSPPASRRWPRPASGGSGRSGGWST
jgi:hypothetical protein